MSNPYTKSNLCRRLKTRCFSTFSHFVGASEPRNIGNFWSTLELSLRTPFSFFRSHFPPNDLDLSSSRAHPWPMFTYTAYPLRLVTFLIFHLLSLFWLFFLFILCPTFHRQSFYLLTLLLLWSPPLRPHRCSSVGLISAAIRVFAQALRKLKQARLWYLWVIFNFLFMFPSLRLTTAHTCAIDFELSFKDSFQARIERENLLFVPFQIDSYTDLIKVGLIFVNHVAVFMLLVCVGFQMWKFVDFVLPKNHLDSDFSTKSTKCISNIFISFTF